jgi:hypothetical protein
MAKASNGQKCQVNPEDLIGLAEESIRCDIADRGALFGLKLIMEDIEHMDRRIEHIDEEIGIYWDKIKGHLYFPTFSGIENFVYISGDSKKFNGSMTKAGSSIIRRV